MDLRALHAAAESTLPETLNHLRQLVQTESPSDQPEAVNAASHLVATWAAQLGGHTIWHRQSNFGDLLELRFGPPSGGNTGKPTLLLGHLDTVWPLSTLAQMPWRENGGNLYGPGILDMKAGVLMAFAALEFCGTLARPVTLLLNSDEEVGSPVSRPITERLALESEAVFVLEPAQGLAYKTARKGVGDYILTITGIAAHSGVDFDNGHSAIREAARLVEIISAFTGSRPGLTVNCGLIRGGTRSNVIAAECVVEVDVRIAQAGDATYIDQLMHALHPSDPVCQLKVTGGINRPPMERTPGTVRLFKQAQNLAAQLGFTLDEAATGGGSDGNFTAALGIPTLDGMGAVGAGAHAAHEHIVLAELAPRTALLAAMLLSL